MSKSLCFIYTITNGYHKTTEFCTKKNLYCFSRLISLKYEICTIVNKKYTIQKTSDAIVIPRCMLIPDEINELYGISQNKAMTNGIDIETILNTFIKDIKDVDIIICYDAPHHLNTIIGESVRYNINMDLSKYLIIDISNFHDNYINIEEAYLKLTNTDKVDDNIIYMIRVIFFSIYSSFKKSIK